MLKSEHQAEADFLDSIDFGSTRSALRDAAQRHDTDRNRSATVLAIVAGVVIRALLTSSSADRYHERVGRVRVRTVAGAEPKPA